MEKSITTINRAFDSFVKEGNTTVQPIETLLDGDKFFPKEGWLWDYKKEYSTNRVGLAKIVKAIVSFHNMYGGYLIFGIDEQQKDTVFAPCGVEENCFDASQLRESINNCTGQYIDVNARLVNKVIGNSDFLFLVLHVPKRIAKLPPVKFVKNGPEPSSSSPLFKEGEVFQRALDQCIKVTKSEDWTNLHTVRDFSRLLGDQSGEEYRASLDHNLPDRQLICPKFVGRGQEIAKLWEWLSDEFEYTKILAGDGGKGKTSIAYRFCEEFVNTAPLGFERVLWFSAKGKQFSPEMNEYFDLQEPDFNDLKSFLSVLGEHCALHKEEYEDLLDAQIKKQLRIALPLVPPLIVVDDVDSLDEEEQKSIVDTCRHLGGQQARFLITTRKRFAYSKQQCIEVQGLAKQDYREFVRDLEKNTVFNK